MNDSPKISPDGASRPTLTLKKKKVDMRFSVPQTRAARLKRSTERLDANVPWGQFWLIWNPAAKRPTRRHPSAASAATEAARLRKKFPLETFHVYQCDALP